MATFLDNITEWNAKANAAIAAAGLAGDLDKVNLWQSLMASANNLELPDAVRLDLLTALITSAALLDTAIAPYNPTQSTPITPQPGEFIHNSLAGLQGGTASERYHVTLAQIASWSTKAGLSDITFANLLGVVSDNAALVAAFAAKQNALSGIGFVKANGSVISYDNSTYLTTISGIAAGGELSGTYPNPTLLNEAVVTKTLGPGYLPTTGTIGNSTTLRGAIAILDGTLAALAASAGTVTSVGVGGVSGLFTSSGGPITTSGTISFSLASQSANRVYASPDGSSGTPTFRALVNADLPISGVTAGTYGGASTIPIVTVNSRGIVTSVSTVAASSGGTVTSVALAAPSQFSISGSPVTTSGTLSFQWSNQAINLVLASPASGGAGLPTFRSLVSDDIPALAISKITGLQAALDSKLNESLQNGKLWLGNASNAPVAVTPSGDWTITNAGVATIANAAVTFAKFQNITAGVLLGRWSPTDGPMQQITIGTGLNLDSSTGVLTSTGGGGAPGGASGQLQWNDSSTFGGIARAYSDGQSIWVQLGNLILADSASSPVNTVTLAGSPTAPRTWTFPDASGTFVGTGAITTSGLTMATARLLGRSTASTGAIEEITIGSGLSLSGGTLSATGGGGGTPGGASGEIQYNAAGSFGGVPELTYSGGVVTIFTPRIGNGGGNGHIHFRYATSVPSGIANFATLYTQANTVGWIFGTNAFQSVFSFAGTATRTYTFPDAGGDVVLNSATQTLTNKTLTSPIINVGSDATGDIYYRDSGGNFTRLPIGTSGQVLTVSSGLPAWASGGGGGGVTAVGTFSASSQTNGATISGSTITFGPADATNPGMVSTGTQTFVGVKTFAATSTVFTTTTAANDGVVIQARAGGSGSFRATITPTTLTASRTITIPDLTGTLMLLENAQTVSGIKTFSVAINSTVSSGGAITLTNGSDIRWGATSVLLNNIVVGSGAFAFGINLWDGSSAIERARFVTVNTAALATDCRFAFGTTSPSHKFHMKDNFAGAVGTGVGAFFVDSIAKTNLTASTEVNNIYFNNNYSWTWATGAITTQRHVLITAPTYAFAAASTITTAATVAISGAPTAGTNATITSPLAFWVQGGRTRLDGPGSWSGLPTGNAGLSSGDLYVDTAANVLSNGDLVVARKV